MANRDRLAALRAQQQGGGGPGYGGGGGGYNDYQQQQGGYGQQQDYGQQQGYGQQQQGYGQQGGNYEPRRANPYAQQDGGAYEMSSRPSAYSTPQQSYATANGGGGDDLSAFYAEIGNIQDDIKRYNDNVAAIADLQSRSLNNMDDNAAQRNQQSLVQLGDEQSQLSGSLKRRIKDLERQGGSGRDGQVKKQQTAFVKSKFVEAIQNYQQIEQQSRTKYKQRMERQFKIVKPDASPEEVRAVVNDEGGGQIFSQALMNSNRYGDSRAAYREVQERHADIKKIEKTLTELAQLFQDMSVLVEQQDETINVIQNNAVNIDQDVTQGYKDTEKAVDSARGARKKRWICFWISVVIIIVIVLVVLFTVKPWEIKTNNNNNNNTSS
ncbi:t-SNARE [Exidia glandulosa HHB12029]|uniref:t-SNARE n=1 Tax=Exidia glandulosa HHB12029 TaxID=1314781 RepID=A0A165G0Z0_EXIGL|nr:t-SNARE [Exidia glandulosa HHB12029]